MDSGRPDLLGGPLAEGLAMITNAWNATGAAGIYDASDGNVMDSEDC